MAWEGQFGRNFAGPVQRGQKPRGQSALDVVIEAGYLPITAGPVEFAAWLREPVDYIGAEITTLVANEVTAQNAPTLAAAAASAAAAAASQGAAAASALAADGSADAAAASEAAAAASAASITGGSFGPGGIQGLETANNSANPTTRIDIAVGQCRSSDNTTDIVLAAPLTKRLDAAWAVGSGNGGKSVATALAAGQTWFVHLIRHPTGPVVDAIFDPSPTAPTLPAGYTKSRCIMPLPVLGSDNSPASGTNIPGYVQYGGRVDLNKPNNEFSAQTGNASPMLKDFVLPVGVKLEALLYLQANYNGTTTLMVAKDPDRGVPTAFGGSDQWAHIRLSTNEQYLTAVASVLTNTLARIYIHISQAGATWAAKTLGYRFLREKL